VNNEEPLTRRAARDGNGSERSGIAGVIGRHPNAWMFSALGVIFLLLGTGAVFAGAAFGSSADGSALVSETPTPEPTRVVPIQPAAATALRTCTINAAAKDPRLLKFEGSVINVTTGEVLFDRKADTPAPPASGLKVLTSAAALMTIGPNFRMTTRVYEGSDPGSIVLVGGGDPTLSALPSGVNSVYAGAPKLSDLAAQTKTAWEANHPGEQITSVILDANYWNPADKWDATWQRSEQTTGYHSEVTALMVDGDRANPQKVTSPRSTDPIGRAGNAFVAALNLGNPVTVSLGNATPGMPKLAEVSSQPIKTLIAQMLPISDNTLAEMIARVVSKESGGGGTAASLNSIISGALVNLGLNTTGLTVRDGSGLSAKNAVPPLLMAQLMAKVSTGAQGLGVIKSALPIAGKTGTLAGRFTGANAVARGHVIAKTGWINSSRTLSGWVNAKDGSVLAFAFYALGPVKSNAMDALDTVATGVYNCGNNLSNN
jgi:D-alanyl-D-alanine carboxypeptidase/D-alanyl-D-alanine-endopeptidase (penicillin-binding protein 4)